MALESDEQQSIARDGHGVLLNVPGRKLSPRISTVEKEIVAIMKKLLANDPSSLNFDWRINI